MSDEPVPVVATVQRLRAAVEAVTIALVDRNDAALLACEGALVEALSAALRIRAVGAADRDAVRAELGRTRAALVHCRALGAALRGVGLDCLQALGATVDYDSDGSMKTNRRRRDLNARA